MSNDVFQRSLAIGGALQDEIRRIEQMHLGHAVLSQICPRDPQSGEIRALYEHHCTDCRSNESIALRTDLLTGG